MLEKFVKDHGLSIADDLDGDPVFLAGNEFYLDYTRERAPGIVFTDVKDRARGDRPKASGLAACACTLRRAWQYLRPSLERLRA